MIRQGIPLTNTSKREESRSKIYRTVLVGNFEAGRTLNILGPSWARLEASRVFILAGALDGRLLRTHLRPVL